MKVIGLTGGIATGKTTVTGYLASLSAPIIDADVINRELLSPNNIGYLEILKLFPDIPLLADSSLDKHYLREQIFNDSILKTSVENILHPLIKNKMKQEIQTLTDSSKHAYCLLSVPLLIEASFQHLVGEIWVTDCSEDTQIQRLMKRDGLSIDNAKLVLSHQLTRKKRLSFANHIIPTENIDKMKACVLTLHKQSLIRIKN